MVVTTRFVVGDECYFIDSNNRPCKSKILAVTVTETAKSTTIDYQVQIENDDYEYFGEEDLCKYDWEMKDKLMSNLMEFV
jgi:hypothetical protein